MSDVEAAALAAGCTPLQAWTLAQLADGKKVEEIALERGVTRRGVWATRASALRRLDRPPATFTNRHAQVMQLRSEGHTWDYIGVEMRISREGARRLHQRASQLKCIQ